MMTIIENDEKYGKTFPVLSLALLYLEQQGKPLINYLFMCCIPENDDNNRLSIFPLARENFEDW